MGQELLPKNEDDSSNFLQRNAICIISLDPRMIEFGTRKNNELALTLILLNLPTRVSNVLIEQPVQRRIFDIDGLSKNRPWNLLAQFYWSSMDLREDLELIWSEPECSKCAIRGGFCGYKADSGLEIACYRPDKSGLPRSAKYGLIIGVGIPGLVCIIGLACYICGMIRSFTLRGHLNPNLPTTFSDQRPVIRSSSGLDKPTIDSYPTTILGESRRLPKTSDVTCPICLSDYQPKETLRSIPECNHYFHAGCIDEWLKLNNTCPLCRNSPESSVATPCSSSLSISSPSSASSSSMTSNRD